MSVTVAKTAGFCFGVQRAYDLAMELVRSGRPACTYGELIHNPQIVSKLYKAGIPAIERVEDNIDRRAVIIRSHGVPPSVYHALAEMGCEVVDATCPYVQKIHKLAAAYAKDSIILIAGDPSHPEVQGIEGFCERHLTFKNADELKSLYTLF